MSEAIVLRSKFDAREGARNVQADIDVCCGGSARCVLLLTMRPPIFGAGADGRLELGWLSVAASARRLASPVAVCLAR